MRWSFLGFAALLALAPRTSRAQANHRLAPVGGRTTLVGGTGLAFGRDSASAYLNPATIVRVDPGRLAFSVAFYDVSVLSASSWYQPGTVDRQHFGDISRDNASITNASFDTLPSSLCIFLRVGDVPFLASEASKTLKESQARLGICIASVQNDDFSLNLEDYQQATANGSSRQSQTVRQSFRRIAAGPTYAMYVTNSMVLGASLHISRAAFSSIFETTATTNGPAGTISSAYYGSAHGDSYDLSATLGATYRMSRDQTVAAVIEAPSIHAFGPAGLNRYTHYDGAGEGTSTTTAHGDFAAYTPLRVAIGTGIERSWGSAELNVSYHFPTGPTYRAQLDGRNVQSPGNVDEAFSINPSAQLRSSVNVGVGAEVYVAPYLSLLAGVGTDLSAAPKNDEGLTNDKMSYLPARTNRVSASVGIGSHGEGGDLLVGGELRYTWGDRLAVNSYVLPPRLETTFTETYGVLLVVAGTTSFKAIRRAVEDLSDVVDPKRPKRTGPEPPNPVLEEPPR
jgi:hypothetical protein